MANKKNGNINALRPVIVAAHNAGNTKAINKDNVLGANVDISYFNSWVVDCNALRMTVAEYVQYKRAKKYGYKIGGKDVTDDVVFAARERIFPKWKEILQVGEKSKDKNELHVSVDDIEDLIGFVWDFTNAGEGHGTVEVIVSEQIFRKKVESLLGCAIAKNEVLGDADRDTLKKFQSAQSRVQKCIDKAAELDTQKKSLQLVLDGIPKDNTDFRDYIQDKINAVEEEEKANNESKANANAELTEVSPAAQRVLLKVRLAK